MTPDHDKTAADDDAENRDKEAKYGDVKSRSADPGQSSYGGFKNEGPSKEAEEQQKKSDAPDR